MMIGVSNNQNKTHKSFTGKEYDTIMQIGIMQIGTSKASLQFGTWINTWLGCVFGDFPTVPYEMIWNHRVETTMYEWIILEGDNFHLV